MSDGVCVSVSGSGCALRFVGHPESAGERLIPKVLRGRYMFKCAGSEYMVLVSLTRQVRKTRQWYEEVLNGTEGRMVTGPSLIDRSLGPCDESLASCWVGPLHGTNACLRTGLMQLEARSGIMTPWRGSCCLSQAILKSDPPELRLGAAFVARFWGWFDMVPYVRG